MACSGSPDCKHTRDTKNKITSAKEREALRELASHTRKIPPSHLLLERNISPRQHADLSVDENMTEVKVYLDFMGATPSKAEEGQPQPEAAPAQQAAGTSISEQEWRTTQAQTASPESTEVRWREAKTASFPSTPSPTLVSLASGTPPDLAASPPTLVSLASETFPTVMSSPSGSSPPPPMSRFASGSTDVPASSMDREVAFNPWSPGLHWASLSKQEQVRALAALFKAAEDNNRDEMARILGVGQGPEPKVSPSAVEQFDEVYRRRGIMPPWRRRYGVEFEREALSRKLQLQILEAAFQAQEEEAIRYGGRAYKKGRVMTVGQYRVGKSALMRAFRKEPFQHTASTRGVERLEVEVTDVEHKDGQWRRLETDASSEQERSLAQALARALNKMKTDDSQPASMEDFVREKVAAVRPASSTTAQPARPESFKHQESKGRSMGLEKLGEDLKLRILNGEITGDEITLSLWDFGGQEVFYGLHHLFIKRGAIFLVLFNMRHLAQDTSDPESNPENLRTCIHFLSEWMRSIQMHTCFGSKRGELPPILLVGTHKDAPSVNSCAAHRRIGELLDKRLRSFPAYQRKKMYEIPPDHGEPLPFFPVDNSQRPLDPTIEDLMVAVVEVAQEEEYMNRVVPESWITFFDALQSLETEQSHPKGPGQQSLEEDEKKTQGRTWLHLEEAVELARRCGVAGGAERVQNILAYLDHFGRLMYDSQDPDLCALVVLNPTKFLVEPATRVICDLGTHQLKQHKTAQAKLWTKWNNFVEYGILDEALLPILWDDHPDKHKEIMSLMLKFGLAVELRDAEDPASTGPSPLQEAVNASSSSSQGSARPGRRSASTSSEFFPWLGRLRSSFLFHRRAAWKAGPSKESEKSSSKNHTHMPNNSEIKAEAPAALPAIIATSSSSSTTTSATMEPVLSRRYLIPDMLPSTRPLYQLQGLDHVALIGFYNRDELKAASNYVTEGKLSLSGFLPTGFFGQLLGKCVNWSQSVSSSAPADVHCLHKCEAILYFGQKQLKLEECTALNAVRVHCERDRPQLIIERVLALSQEIVRTCMAGALELVPYIRWQEPGQGQEGLLVQLSKLQKAVDEGESLVVGPKRLSPEEIQATWPGWFQAQPQPLYYGFLCYRDVSFDESLASKLSDRLLLDTRDVQLKLYLQHGRVREGQHSPERVSALAQSSVMVPLVSPAALKPLYKLKANSPADSVLEAWVLGLELHELGQLKCMLPLLVGKCIRHPTDLSAKLLPFEKSWPDTEGNPHPEDGLPQVVVKSVVEKVTRLLNQNSLCPSKKLKKRTVRATFKALMKKAPKGVGIDVAGFFRARVGIESEAIKLVNVPKLAAELEKAVKDLSADIKADGKVEHVTDASGDCRADTKALQQAVEIACRDAKKLLEGADMVSLLDRLYAQPERIQYHCFLSHYQFEAASHCQLLLERLKHLGLKGWYDKAPETERVDKVGMVEAVARSACVIAYVTKGYFTRRWCQFELLVAKTLQVPVVVIRQDDGPHMLTFEELPREFKDTEVLSVLKNEHGNLHDDWVRLNVEKRLRLELQAMKRKGRTLLVAVGSSPLNPSIGSLSKSWVWRTRSGDRYTIEEELEVICNECGVTRLQNLVKAAHGRLRHHQHSHHNQKPH
eukprot:g15478.t1